MRVFFLGFFICALVAGCASTSRSPKKPSPYRYAQPRALARAGRT
jgi:uncharacterized protein YceK